MYKKILLLPLLQLILTPALLSQDANPHFARIHQAFVSPGSNVVLIAAHRGSHLDYPENSMAAFSDCIKMGIDIIELDVRCTKDGLLVLMHDRTVNRTTNGTGAVDSMTFDEIRKLRLKHNGRLTNEQVPTLEEALNLARGKIMVDLDIKTADCTQAIMETVTKTNTVESAFFFVSRADHAKFLKDKNPAFITLVRTQRESQIDSVYSVVKTEAVHIDPSHNTLTAVNKIKSNGGRVWINALGEVDKKAAAGNLAAFNDVLSNGANIIQTDQPALLMKYLKSKNLYHQSASKMQNNTKIKNSL